MDAAVFKRGSSQMLQAFQYSRRIRLYLKVNTTMDKDRQNKYKLARPIGNEKCSVLTRETVERKTLSQRGFQTPGLSFDFENEVGHSLPMKQIPGQKPSGQFRASR